MNHAQPQTPQRQQPERRNTVQRENRATITRARNSNGATIRVVNTWMPEQITWYECPRCGRPANLDGETPPHCPLCGARAVARTWTRPNDKAPAPRPGRYEEVPDAHPRQPLPDGEYRVVRKTRTPD
jgi:DNA-directed RNA polymerase subunit RPC12/RpoP